jgi:hypothetical protein
MASPSAVTLTTKNTYYKVADNITSGVINIKAWQPSNYYLTYVTHSAAAPTDDSTSIICRDWSIGVTNTAAIDVYMSCSENNGIIILFS